MAKLSKSDAAKVSGVSRQTLYVYLREGRLSADPDGRIDTAELLRAGFTLQGLQSADSQAVSEDVHELTPRSDMSDTLVDILRDQIQILREELQDARAERGSPRAYRRTNGHAARIPPAEPTPPRHAALGPTASPGCPRSPAGPPPVQSDVVAPTQPGGPRGEMRRIVALLCEYPEGLTPAEIRERLGVERSLGDTLLGMRRDGLVQRVGPGRYVVA